MKSKKLFLLCSIPFLIGCAMTREFGNYFDFKKNITKAKISAVYRGINIIKAEDSINTYLISVDNVGSYDSSENESVMAQAEKGKNIEFFLKTRGIRKNKSQLSFQKKYNFYECFINSDDISIW